ncbi:MAG: hypothetical protein CBD58_02545 [bacterium TMED198]|nr:MAG: hypothetical protein CBD58_02545 [bacterium TMED198]
MNLSSLLFFMFSFLLSGDAIFYIKDSLFTTNNLFDKFSQRDWEGQSYTQKTKVLDQYINQELALIEASQIGLAKDPYINVKTKKRKEEQMVRFGFEWFSCFPSLSNKDLSFGQDKIVKEYKIKLILISHKNSTSRGKSKRTKQEALLLAQSISKNSTSLKAFDSLMVLFSEDPSLKKNKGYLGWYGWGSLMKQFDDKIFIQNKGETTKPIDTSVGYVVLFLEKERASRYASLNKKQLKDVVVDASIRRLPVETKRTLYEVFKKKTLDSLNVKYNYSYLKKIIKHYQHENNKRKVSGQYKTDVVVALEDFNNIGVVCTVSGEGYGLKWFLNKFKNIPFSKRPKLDNIEAVIASLDDVILRSVVVDLFNKNLLFNNYVYSLRNNESITSLLFNEYYKYIISTAKSPDSTDVVGYYNNNKTSKYLVEPSITLREIKVSTVSLADSLYSLIKKGVPFEAVAADFSLTNPGEGGLVGPIEESSFKNYYNMTKNLNAKEVSGIYNNNDNTYSFVYLLEKKDSSFKPLNLVYKKIESLLKKEYQDEAKSNSLFNLPIKHNVKRCSFLNYKYLEEHSQPDSSTFNGYYYSNNNHEYIIKETLVDSVSYDFVLKKNYKGFWVYILGDSIIKSQPSNVVANLKPNINKHLFITNE